MALTGCGGKWSKCWHALKSLLRILTSKQACYSTNMTCTYADISMTHMRHSRTSKPKYRSSLPHLRTNAACAPKTQTAAASRRKSALPVCTEEARAYRRTPSHMHSRQPDMWRLLRDWPTSFVGEMCCLWLMVSTALAMIVAMYWMPAVDRWGWGGVLHARVGMLHTRVCHCEFTGVSVCGSNEMTPGACRNVHILFVRTVPSCVRVMA